MSETVVIGGSGPSLLHTDLRRIPRDVRIVRVNNFFLEPIYHLGRSVDCVYFSADRRALRFYVATLRRLSKSGDYDIHSTASAHPIAARLAAPAPFTPIKIEDTQIRSVVATARRQSGILPTTGIIAVIAEVERGASSVILTGLDFYADAERYSYTPRGNLERILRPNTASSGYDTRFHSYHLDTMILQMFVDRGVTFTVANNLGTPVGPFDFPCAPLLPSDQHLRVPDVKTDGVDDWVRYSGLVPIDMLLAARYTRRQLNRVSRSFLRRSMS